MHKLSFRTLRSEDKDWLAEIVNDPEVAKYSLSIYPRTEHEVEEFLRKDLDDGNEAKHVVAEVDGEPAGGVDLWWRAVARDRHVASVGICVRRKHWGKGVGYGLMKEAERIGKELGLRKLALGVFSGNDRALRLYEKSGYRREACEHEEVYIDGSWRYGYYMTLELAKCEPRHKAIARTETKRGSKSHPARERRIQIRQLGGRDLEEVNRLQNCTVSTESSFRIPPVTKEETKRWYEGIKSEQGKYCIACFDGDRILGYLHFRALLPPFSSLRLEEIIVDEDQRPSETANALVAAFKNFKERYWYHRVFASTPETSSHVINALTQNGFKNSGTISSYYCIDGYYVDVGLYGYP